MPRAAAACKNIDRTYRLGPDSPDSQPLTVDFVGPLAGLCDVEADQEVEVLQHRGQTVDLVRQPEVGEAHVTEGSAEHATLPDRQGWSQPHHTAGHHRQSW